MTSYISKLTPIMGGMRKIEKAQESSDEERGTSPDEADEVVA